MQKRTMEMQVFRHCPIFITTKHEVKKKNLEDRLPQQLVCNVYVYHVKTMIRNA